MSVLQLCADFQWKSIKELWPRFGWTNCLVDRHLLHLVRTQFIVFSHVTGLQTPWRVKHPSNILDNPAAQGLSTFHLFLDANI